MWYSVKNNSVALRIFLKPKASKTKIVDVNDHELIIAVAARPIEGEANKMLISYLATLLKLCKNDIQLLRGDTSRHKKISIPLTETTQCFMKNPLGFISHD